MTLAEHIVWLENLAADVRANYGKRRWAQAVAANLRPHLAHRCRRQVCTDADLIADGIEPVPTGTTR